MVSLGMVFSCQEKYSEERFDVIVPVIEVENSDDIIVSEDQGIVGDIKSETESSSAAIDDESLESLAKKNIDSINKNIEKPVLKLVEPKIIEVAKIDPKIEIVKEQNRTSPKNTEVVEEVSKEMKVLDEKPLQSDEIELKPKPENDRDKLQKKWLSVKNFASRRGFSEEDVENLLPETLSIQNYIKFGDPKATLEKINVIEEKLKTVRISRGYVRQKLGNVMGLVASSKVSADEKIDFNMRLEQVSKGISNSDFDRSNRELNEVIVDLGQIRTLDKVFEN